jgi:hypothetical protein
MVRALYILEERAGGWVLLNVEGSLPSPFGQGYVFDLARQVIPSAEPVSQFLCEVGVGLN